jgi:hypothetical protein
MNPTSTDITRIARAGATAVSGRRILVVATLITFALWFVPYSNYILYPIRLFVTFVHESGHALAATLTGGSVDYIRIFGDGSGVTYTRTSPVWTWLVLSGGYLGAALFGSVMLHVGRLRQSNAGRLSLYAASLYMMAITLLWTSPFHSIFTVVTGMGLAVILFVLGRLLSGQAALIVSSFLAVQCCLDALSDLRVLVNLTSTGSRENDAAFMAKFYFIPATLCALIWCIMALTILGFSLHNYWRATRVGPVARRA